ncbi:MAG: hypothetical protein GY928_10245 [Colwellia sp.]|nr:hypothetical protein [Colwellia sp.]
MSEQSSANTLNSTESGSKTPNKKISILFELIRFITPYKSQVLAAFVVLIFTVSDHYGVKSPYSNQI